MYRTQGAVGVGNKAPGFRGRDVLGREIDLSGYLGRNIVLFFYRNSRCKTCREELKSLAARYYYIAQQDGEVVAISTDGPDVAKNLAVDLHLPFPVISDPDGGIIRLYGVYDRNTDTSYPAVYLIDKDGVVSFRKILGGLDDLLPADDIVDKLRGAGSRIRRATAPWSREE